MPSHSLSLPVRARQRVAWLVGRLPPWARGRVLAAGSGITVVVVALLGGVLSGKLEHAPTTRLAAPAVTEAVTIAPTTTSTAPPTAAEVQALEANVVDDMTLDVTSERLDADVRRRLALAETPSAVARRHAEIVLAWAPDKAATIQARYDQAVRHAAADPSTFSVTDAAFVVTQWGQVTISGTTAQVTCRGHYRLVEPNNPQARRGTIQQGERNWSIAVVKSGGRWRLEDRSAT